MHPSEFIARCTVRIQSIKNDGKPSGGTGFFFAFNQTDTGYVPVIITNKHVVSDISEMIIFISIRDLNSKTTTESVPITIEKPESRFIFHPDSRVDIAALPIADLIFQMKRAEKELILYHFGMNDIPSDEEFNKFLFIEDVISSGYPNGIFDEVNNMPVIRRGITATHPGLNWKGQDKFLIDMAIFPGASGSPVFIYNPSGFTDSEGNINIGGVRIKLIGIVYAVLMHDLKGKIEVSDIPAAMDYETRMKTPNNIGVVYNSKLLKWFEAFFRNKTEEK